MWEYGSAWVKHCANKGIGHPPQLIFARPTSSVMITAWFGKQRLQLSPLLIR